MSNFQVKTRWAFQEISSVIKSLDGDSQEFGRILRHSNIPHISFSQIYTVEFCHYAYFLEYVKKVSPNPTPVYFTKGRLLHQIIANIYSKLMLSQNVGELEFYDLVDAELNGLDNKHVKNSINVVLNNIWKNYRIVAIEKPFVMVVDDELPPVVGIIDLILEKEGRYFVIDHKSGRDFYPQDPLQMAIYAMFIESHFPSNQIEFFYDHYRWVNNLSRIRKPALFRNKVKFQTKYGRSEIKRINTGFKAMAAIKGTGSAIKFGQCFRCPYYGICWNSYRP